MLRVWDPARPTRLLTDASELAVSAILEQPDDTGAFHLVAFESHKLTPIARTLLGLLAVVHALKALRPYLLHKPFELHTDNVILQRLQQQHHVSHHQARWLNLLAEYQYRAVHNSTVPRARRRTRATTSRIRRLRYSPFLARPPLPPS